LNGSVGTIHSGTGRLATGLSPSVQEIVFGTVADHAVDEELPYLTTIDEAHVVMLAEHGLVGQDTAAGLLIAIDALRERNFDQLRGRPAPRGIYLSYEDHLTNTLGPEFGGALQIGRSRNDLKATMHQLRLRRIAADLLSGLLWLQAVLLGRARRHSGLVMPAYSQFQPAVPITYGHYLLGVAAALDADITGFTQACAGVRRSPLGAAGGGGTDVPIDPTRTAELLGFTEPIGHAGYAVGSRDVLSRVLSAGALIGVTLSRLATDLQLWSTQEFDLVGFPDSLVGSSSAMPQKRNPFLLEHVKGVGGVLIGALVSAMTNMKNTPFGNSVEVSTEGVAPIWPALARLHDALRLTIRLVSGARPDEALMSVSADRGYVTATSLANSLLPQGVPFRTAHRSVGRVVTGLLADGIGGFAEVATAEVAARLNRALAEEGVAAPVTVDRARLDPSAVMAMTEFGGGPGAESFRAEHERLTARWREQARQARTELLRVRAADDRRRSAVRDLTAAYDIGSRT
jgi:argininosuccinate lyase